MTRSNYDITRDLMRDEFLKYDQFRMISRFDLKHDKQYLYIRFVSRQYRIDRSTGVIDWSSDGFRTTIEADYNVCMTIYDVLCWSKDDAKLSGSYCTIKMLKGTVKSELPGKGMLQERADYYNGRIPLLKAACRRIGHEISMGADASFLLNAFDFLPVILQYWDGDDEFSPVLKFMFDENIIEYMHFETIYYMMSHILSRLREEEQATD